MICRSRRNGFISESLSFFCSDLLNSEKSVPLKKIDPSVGLTRRKRRRPVVVLPLPLSPASPRISPFLTEKLIPSTALTVISSLETKVSKKPFFKGKCFFNFTTSTTTSPLNSFIPLVEMAGHQVFALPRFFQRWNLFLADIHDVRATWIEPAP